MEVSAAVAFIIAGVLVSGHRALKHTCLALVRSRACILLESTMILSGHVIPSLLKQAKTQHF